MSPDIVAVPIAEVSKLIASATDERYQVAVLLASEAGLRIGKIRGLQWGDLKHGQLTVRRAIDQFENVTTPKHDKRRSVPLSPALGGLCAVRRWLPHEPLRPDQFSAARTRAPRRMTRPDPSARGCSVFARPQRRSAARRTCSETGARTLPSDGVGPVAAIVRCQPAQLGAKFQDASGCSRAKLAWEAHRKQQQAALKAASPNLKAWPAKLIVKSLDDVPPPPAAE